MAIPLHLGKFQVEDDEIRYYLLLVQKPKPFFPVIGDHHIGRNRAGAESLADHKDVSGVIFNQQNV